MAQVIRRMRDESRGMHRLLRPSMRDLGCRDWLHGEVARAGWTNAAFRRSDLRWIESFGAGPDARRCPLKTRVCPDRFRAAALLASSPRAELFCHAATRSPDSHTPPTLGQGHGRADHVPSASVTGTVDMGV
jgi:hypothetical protein